MMRNPLKAIYDASVFSVKPQNVFPKLLAEKKSKLIINSGLSGSEEGVIVDTESRPVILLSFGKASVAMAASFLATCR